MTDSRAASCNRVLDLGTLSSRSGRRPRIRPDMIGEWFVVSQLTAHPALAKGLRAGLTDRQATRALSFLAAAADHMDSASGLFSEFTSGGLRRRPRRRTCRDDRSDGKAAARQGGRRADPFSRRLDDRPARRARSRDS